MRLYHCMSKIPYYINYLKCKLIDDNNINYQFHVCMFYQNIIKTKLKLYYKIIYLIR